MRWAIMLVAFVLGAASKPFGIISGRIRRSVRAVIGALKARGAAGIVEGR